MLILRIKYEINLRKKLLDWTFSNLFQKIIGMRKKLS